jgi:hypothetical protein
MSAGVTNAQETRFPLRYYVTLAASDGTSVTVLRGQNPPVITDGVGGWEIIPRRRRKAMTSWTGRNPIAMDLPLLFDGGGQIPVSVDGDINTLRQMAVGDNFTEPPTVKLTGALPAPGVTWVINDLEWGSDVSYERDPLTNTDMRTRQDVVVKLLQYVQEDQVKVIPTAGVPGIWITEKGQTLRSIAKEVYGDASMWTLIRDANPGVRDPNHIPEQTKLVIPPKPTGKPSVNPGHPSK